jgi:hypothetical protein
VSGAEAAVSAVAAVLAVVHSVAVTVPPAVELWQAVMPQGMQAQQYQRQQWRMVRV